MTGSNARVHLLKALIPGLCVSAELEALYAWAAKPFQAPEGKFEEGLRFKLTNQLMGMNSEGI